VIRHEPRAPRVVTGNSVCARERHASAGIGLISLGSPAVKLVGWIVVSVALIEVFAAQDPPTPAAQIWAAAAGGYGAINMVQFSPDGRTLATVDSIGHAALWNVAMGRWSETQPACFDRIRTLAFSPDGVFLAAGTLDSTIILWDLNDLQIRAELRAHSRPVNALAFSLDGRLLASAGGDGTMILWNISVESPSGYRISSSSSVVSMAFSPDGASLATSHNSGEVRIRKVASPEVSTLVDWFAEVPRALAFSHDGRTLAASGVCSSEIRCWDPATQQTRASLRGPGSGVPALAFSADGKLLVVAGSDGVLQIRDLIADRQWTVKTGHCGRVWSLAFSPDGRTLVSGGNDHGIRLWDVGKLIAMRGRA
jgi:WD40 repeat protein